MIAPRTWRLATLVAAPALVALATTGPHRGEMLQVIGLVLICLWLVLAGVLAGHFVDAYRARKDGQGDATSPWDRIDVLTASGATMLWTGAGALVASSLMGWASLSVVGVLGVSIVYLAAIWTGAVGSSARAWRRATVAYAVKPELAIEGDPLREEITIGDVGIPVGMRLFVLGRAQRHGVMSRYVVDGRDAAGEVRLESELGPAYRGEHHAPPLALWFGDVLGLSRTAVAHRGTAAFTVVPRLPAVDGAAALLGAGGDDAMSVPTRHAPTEGTFRIREYAPGDDARRIHWVRSVQQNQLVVRLPDEVPPAEPAVRLILDNDLFGTESLTCRAPDEMLDVLVRVWLGIGKALADTGTRVTLVAVVDKAGTMTAIERPLLARNTHSAVRLGSRIAWQTKRPLESVVADRRAKQVVVSSRPRRVAGSELTWVVVPEVAWTTLEVDPPLDQSAKLPYPIGSAENRPSRLARERLRANIRWQDRAVFSQVVCWTDWTRFAGDHIARPNNGRVTLAVIP
jgi:uncharacterized protein (DUF58 family)